MKNISKLIKITAIMLITTLFLNGAVYAAGNAAIQQLKETQRLDKSNPYGKNVFKSFIKSLIEENLIKKLPDISKIETFINDASAGALSLYNVPRLSKYLANKIKQSVVDGVIAPMRGDELIQKLKNIQRPHLPAGKFDPANQCTGCDGCDLEKFIETNLVNSYSGVEGAISAGDNANVIFKNSQDSIIKNDYANLVKNFDACVPEIDRLMKEMPALKSCTPKNCESCYSNYYTLYSEYLFIKKYVTIQKGYFLLKSGKYNEAGEYFKKVLQAQATPAAVAARLNLTADKKAIIEWYKKALEVTLFHFIGRCLYEQNNYSEALSYFNKSTITNVPKPPAFSFGDDPELMNLFIVYPYSGLYSDFSPYGDDAVRAENGKRFFWPWQSYYFIGVYHYKSGDKKNALLFLKAYITGVDKEYEKEARKLIAELEAGQNTPVEIAELKFMREDGSEVKWGDILEPENAYIIQAITKMPCNEETLKVRYNSDYTKPQVGEWILSKKSNSNDKIFEYKILIDRKIVGMIDKSKTSFMTLDFVKDPDNSNFEDSKEFITQCTQQGYLNKGTFRAQKGMNVAAESITNPVMPNSIEAMKSAGVEYLKLECGSVCRVIPFACQADILYFSGHGIMKTGNLIIDADKSDKDVYLTPEMIDKWASNLKIVFLAGCSVLNMRSVCYIYNTPGYKWCDKGPILFLGYAGKAPKDMQNNTNTTTKIIKDFFGLFRNNNKYVKSWLYANYCDYGYNACSIVPYNKEFYFFNWIIDINIDTKYPIFTISKIRYIDVKNY